MVRLRRVSILLLTLLGVASAGAMAQTDIQVVKTTNNQTPVPTQQVIFTIKAINQGSVAATNVVINDVLQSGLSYSSHAAPAGSTFTPGTGNWAISSISPGATVTMTITATVTATTYGQLISNTASLSSLDQTDTNASNNQSTVYFTVCSIASDQCSANLGISIAASPTTNLNNNQTLTYTIVVQNAGPTAATGVIVRDSLLAGVSYVSSSATAGSYDPIQGVWNVPFVTNGGSQTLTLVTQVNNPTTNTYTNTASIKFSSQIDPVSTNNTASVTSTFNRSDIQITKTVSNGPYFEGNNLTYTVKAKNNGPLEATGLQVKDLLVNTLDFVSSTQSGSTTYSAGTGIWNIGTLNNGSEVTLTIIAKPKPGTSGQQLNNTASISALNQVDIVPANNSASVEILVASPDLIVEKKVSKSNPEPGELLTYEVKLTNDGPGAATNILVTDVLPQGLTFVSFTQIPSGSSASRSGDTIKWVHPTLGDGNNRTLKFTATVNLLNTAARTITNTAEVDSFDQVDANNANNTSSAPITVKGADLEVIKSVSNQSPAIGNTIVYKIKVTNKGPEKSEDVIIQDLLPLGVTFVSATASEGSYNSITGIWGGTGIDYNENEVDSLLITVTVNPGTTGSVINNTAFVLSSTTPDGITNNNSSSAFFVVGNADLSLTKTANAPKYNIGDPVVYTLTLTNNGPNQAAGFSVSDPLPSGINFVSSSATLGSYNASTGVWSFGNSTLANGSSATLTINATVASNTAGFTITNTATAKVIQTGNSTANDIGQAIIKVSGADLAITKTASSTNPLEGGTLTYTLVVTNNGPDAASGIVVTDILPTNLTYTSSSGIGIYDPVNGQWSVGTLANGASATLTLNTNVKEGGNFTNTASITASSAPDDNLANNSSSVFISSLKSFTAGACIIDLGGVQTQNRGLRPYGLVYQIVRTFKVPVYWAINPSKSFGSPTAKVDQVDFSVAGINYSSGAFIIPAEFVPTVQALINQWVSAYPGLKVDCNRPAFSAPIHGIISSFPNAVLDEQNGDKAIDAFYEPAGVPASSYRSDGQPSNLAACDDVYFMPHADPQKWDLTERTTLDNFIKNGGWLFAACHSGSALETLVDLNGDGKGDLNYLSNAGLVEWGDHGKGTPPYSYSTGAGQYAASTASDPFMQFLGTLDGALQNGSEQIFIPFKEGWRSSTTIAIWDPDQPEVISGKYPPGKAAALAYGRAFGNPNYGMVMEMASHTFNGGSTAENVAAGRVVGNFLLQAGIQFAPKIIPLALPTQVVAGSSSRFSVKVEASTTQITYNWSSSCGGTFTNPTSATTDFIAPAISSNTECIIRLEVSDNCERENLLARSLIVLPKFDFGDAPDPTFPTLFANNGARHVVTDTMSFYLGSRRPDVETDGQPTADALGDGADEDGVTIPDTIFAGQSAFFDVQLSTTTFGSGGKLSAWIDWNGNGSWADAGENIGASLTDGGPLDGDGLKNGRIRVNVDVPCSGFTGVIFARFRYSSQGGLSYDGAAIDGEVEDYKVIIAGDRIPPIMLCQVAPSAPAASGQCSANVNVPDVGLTDNCGVGSLTWVMTGATIANSPISGINQVGSFTFNVGETVITYTASDNKGNKSTCSVTVKVTDNVPPVAQPDNSVTDEDVAVTINVISNDSDNCKLDTASITTGCASCSLPTNGSIVKNSNGTFTYTPNPDYNGIDQFVYQICDAAGLCDTAKVTITITPVNDLPTARRDNYNIQENSVANLLPILTNDTFGGDGPSSSAITITKAPNHGVASVNNGGTATNPTDDRVSYTPTAFYSGLDSLIYQICDSNGDCDTALVVLNIIRVTGPPIATNDFNNTRVDTPVSGNVATNDTDPQGLLLTFTKLSNPTSGTLTAFNPTTGQYTYTPNTGFIGTDSYRYYTCNSANLCDTATVTIKVIPKINVNSVVANDDATQTQQNTPVKIVVLANDLDPEGDALTAPTLVPGSGPAPSTGSVVYNAADSTFTYTPTTGFNGTATFKYRLCDVKGTCDTATVTIDIVPDKPGNDPPIAVDDASLMLVNQSVTASVAKNDRDPNGDPLIFTKISNPTKGVVVFNSNGTYTYTPNNNYLGPDRFVYIACDNGNPSLCDSATVYLTVLAAPPIATNDFNNTRINTPVSGNVSTNDSDPQGFPLTFTKLTDPANGTLVFNPTTGVYTYTPNTGFTGTDSFRYYACSPLNLCDTATVTLKVIPKIDINSVVANNDATQTPENTPVKIRVLGNDFDPQGDGLSAPTLIPGSGPAPSTGTVAYNAADSTFTYTPATGFKGTATFRYRLCDVKGACDTATVTIDIVPKKVGNNPPIAVDDAKSTLVNTPVGGTVAANDSDPEGNPLTFKKLTDPSNGGVVFNPDGTFTYTPTNNYLGPDRFVYVVCEVVNPSFCDTATVYLTVLAAPPIATNDFNNTLINTPVSGNVSTNDSDPQGFPLTFTKLTDPANGTLVFNPTTGVYTYTPNTGFTGTDSFRYYACSPLNLCDTATVTLKVIPLIQTNSVVANDDATQTLINTAVKIVVKANDADPQGDALGSVTKLTDPAPGTGSVVYNASDSTFTYTPATGFKGTATFRYRLCDVKGACDTATVTIDIVPKKVGNNPPIAVDDATTTVVNTPVSGTVATNDRDPEGDPLTFTQLTNPVNGTVLFNPNGTFTYTPATDYTGPDRFVYEVCDNGNPKLCDTATVYLTVLVNDLYLLPRVYLQGSLFGVTYTNSPTNTIVDSLMRDELRVKGLIPLKAPTNLVPASWGAIADSITNTNIFTVTGRNAIVDWVFVELRNANDSTVVVAKRWALLQRDGDIVDTDGVSLLRFRGIPPARYFVAVRHRNHLGVMTKGSILMKLTGNVVDFRLPSTPVFVLGPQIVNVSMATVIQGKGLWAGNSLQDKVVVYQGTGNDVNVILQQVLGAVGNINFKDPNFILKGYHNGDVNMNGEVIFQGTGNDAVFIYQNVITHPGNAFKENFYIIKEQLPGN